MGGLSLAVGMASSIVSAVQSRKAANEQKKKEGYMEQQRFKDEDIFNKQYYQDITKRTEVQNLLRVLDENQRKAEQRDEAKAAILGSTPEQQLASKEVNRRTFADTVANIASNASNLRDRYLDKYQGRYDRYYANRLGFQDELAAIHQNKSNQWAQTAVNAFNSGAKMLGEGIDSMGSNTPTQTTVPGQTDITTPPPADNKKLEVDD